MKLFILEKMLYIVTLFDIKCHKIKKLMCNISVTLV